MSTDSNFAAQTCKRIMQKSSLSIWHRLTFKCCHKWMDWRAWAMMSGNDAAQTKRKNNLLPRAVSRLHLTRIAILPLTLKVSGVLAGMAMLPALLLICPRILGSSSSQGEAVLSLRPCVADLCSWITRCKLQLWSSGAFAARQKWAWLGDLKV